MDPDKIERIKVETVCGVCRVVAVAELPLVVDNETAVSGSCRERVSSALALIRCVDI